MAIFWQYQLFLETPDIAKLTMIPSSVSRNNLWSGARYFRVQFNQPLTSLQFNQSFSVDITPKFQYTTYFSSERAIAEAVIGSEQLSRVRGQLDKAGIYQKMMETNYSNKTDFVIERLGEPLIPYTTYTIQIKSNHLNLFSLITGKYSKVFTLHTFANTEDERNNIKRSFTYSVLPVYLNSPAQ